MKTFAFLAAAALTMSATAQDRFADVQINAEEVGTNVHMMTGAGGNMALLHGPDGVLLVDDQYQQLAEQIGDKINALTGQDVRYVVNTHFHGDHVGSNTWLRENHDATIFAHHNVRKRLSNDEDFRPEGLPQLTFDSEITFHINGETVHIFYLPSGHTDGDAAVWFENANVLHTGDLLFNERFPFIDLGSGGNVANYISNAETLISKVNDDTVIIPGHGPKATRADYQRFVDMIKATQAEVDSMREQGLSLEEALGQGLSDKWQPWAWNFITEERWIKTLY